MVGIFVKFPSDYSDTAIGILSGTFNLFSGVSNFLQFFFRFEFPSFIIFLDVVFVADEGLGVELFDGFGV